MNRAFSPEECIAAIQIFYAENGRVPSYRDFHGPSRPAGTPGLSTIVKRFGSFNKAIISAGLTPSPRHSEDLAAGEIRQAIRSLCAKNGRPPVWSDFTTPNQPGGLPTITNIIKVFGSFDKAVIDAGLAHVRTVNARKCSMEECISAIQRFHSEYGRVPVRQDFVGLSRPEWAPSATIVTEVFGSWNKAIVAAGFRLRKSPGTETAEEIVQALLKFAAENNRAPKLGEWTSHERPDYAPSSSTVIKIFGSWKEGLGAAGLSVLRAWETIRLPGVAAQNAALTTYKFSARKRSLEWSLTDDEALALMQEDCAYCGTEPALVQRAQGRFPAPYLRNGIDRTDSNKGYIPSNAVTCCFPCNGAKGNMSTEEFLALAKRITQYQSETKTIEKMQVRRI
jgi:hypothetical protein